MYYTHATWSIPRGTLVIKQELISTYIQLYVYNMYYVCMYVYYLYYISSCMYIHVHHVVELGDTDFGYCKNSSADLIMGSQASTMPSPL